MPNTRPGVAAPPVVHYQHSAATTTTTPFPQKLYRLLEDAPHKGFEHIIAWQPGGKSFKVYQPEAFASFVMQNYMVQTKFKSFQRQLNIYG